MHVTWWMPGMPAVLAATLYSFELAVRSRCSLILVTTRIHVTLGLRFGAGPDLGRHRLLDLLLEMGDEADRASHHCQAAGDPPWQLHLARDGSDRPGRIDRKVASGGPGSLFPDQPHELHLVAREAVFGGKLEK